MKPRMVRVVVADDHPVVREGTCSVLEREPRIKVVAQAGSFVEADSMLRAHPADVLLLDLGKMGGPEVSSVRELVRSFPTTAVVVASVMVTFLPDLVAVGVRGYVAKDDPSNHFIDAVIAAATGQTYLSPTATQWMGRHAAGPGRDRLTAREDQVLRLLVAGKQESEMADIMNVDVRTIYNYIYTTRVKTACRDRAELIDWFRRAYDIDP